MKFKITNTKYDDSLIVSEDTIEKVRGSAIYECAKRNWDSEDCYSEEIKEN